VGSKVAVSEAKGRPLLTWVGKRPIREVIALPAQEVERFTLEGPLAQGMAADDWPTSYQPGGHLFHGENKEVLGHLLASGFRGKVDLVYIDPPFDSGANYVRTVTLRGPSGAVDLAGESYSLGEQIQYSDLWSSDNYLQFMYERLLLLKELLSPTGSIYLHCDWRRVQHLRILLDEVFGPDNLLNEVIWYFPNKLQGNVRRFATNHHNLLWYAKNRDAGEYHFRRIEEQRERAIKVNRRYWDDVKGVFATERDEAGNVLYAERSERIIDDVWIVPAVSSAENKQEGYPTQKPDELLERVILSSCKPGGLVLDCFIGSGTAALVAQRHGYRWIGVDINKGSIQTTAKRLMEEMTAQAQRSHQTTADGTGSQPPAQLSFVTHRVNDYDLTIQHNEAVELACSALGIEQLKTDGFFDGTLGRQLVRVVPFNHPASPLDIEEVITELGNRPTEERDVTVVALGKELACEARVAEHNRPGAPNKITLIELRTDPRVAGFFAHESAYAHVGLEEGDLGVRVVIEEFVSPSILERLRQQGGLVSPQVTDWRAMVDSVMIDPSYDGNVFKVGIADVPDGKADLVAGSYDLPASSVGDTIAVKVTDMLGEEVLVTLPRG
jgi:DNA modification methylase